MGDCQRKWKEKEDKSGRRATAASECLVMRGDES